MDELRSHSEDGSDKDYSQFLRIPEGECELLSARYRSQRFGRHSHDRYALGVITQGVEKLYYRGAHYLGDAGSVVTITPDEIHDGLPVDDVGWGYRMLYVEPKWLNDVVLQGHSNPEYVHLFHQPMTKDKDLATSLLSAHNKIAHSPLPLERETILIEVLADVFQRNGASLGLITQTRSERDAVRRIKKKLDREWDQNVSLETLGLEVGMDPLYLIRVFKREVGVPPHSYQIQKRIAKAQAFLRAGMGISEASMACGFFDQSHMARAFKKMVGVTPAVFRDGLCGNRGLIVF